MKRNIGVVLYFITSLVFLLPPQSYLHDILYSFAVQAILGYGIVGIVVSFYRSMLVASVSFAASLLVAGGLSFSQSSSMDLGNISAQSHHESTAVRVAHFNVLCSNKQFEETARAALATRADLVSFQEVNPVWGCELEQMLSEEYPYYRIVANREMAGLGLAVFSKYPLENTQTMYWQGMPNITGDLLIQGKTIHFVTSHTRSPRSRWRYQQRNQHIRQIAQYIKTVDRPTLAIGDYNVVPWNPVIQELRETTQLKDSHTGWEPTFPARMRAVGVPIDYIFHSPEFHCRKFKAIPVSGSDHRGIVGEYSLSS